MLCVCLGRSCIFKECVLGLKLSVLVQLIICRVYFKVWVWAALSDGSHTMFSNFLISYVNETEWSSEEERKRRKKGSAQVLYKTMVSLDQRHLFRAHVPVKHLQVREIPGETRHIVHTSAELRDTTALTALWQPSCSTNTPRLTLSRESQEREPRGEGQDQPACPIGGVGLSVTGIYCTKVTYLYYDEPHRGISISYRRGK